MGRITAIRTIPTDQLRRHPRNIRDDLGDTSELAASLLAQGILQPLLVAERPGGVYVVIDGNRRLAAAREARVPALPCLITTEDTREATVATMLAAAMHKQLAPLEQSAAFRDLLDSGLTITQIAKATGYSTATVRDRLRLDQLPDDAKGMLTDGTLTTGQATVLARQVAKNGHGATNTAAPKTTWLDRQHPLAPAVAVRCTEQHRATRVVIGGANGAGCGQCWQAVIEDTILARAQEVA